MEDSDAEFNWELSLSLNSYFSVCMMRHAQPEGKCGCAVGFK